MTTVSSLDGTTIGYDRAGDGPTVVLVGGAFQYRAFDPRTTELQALLAKGLSVIHYDRRGRGESTDTPPYSTAREVEDLAALIERCGGSAMLYGMSSGALLALEAVAAGLPVTRLAIYEAPVMVDGSRPPVPPGYRERLRAALAEGRRGDAVALFLTEAVGVPAEQVAGMRQAPMFAGMEAVAPTLAYDSALLDGLDSGAPLPAARWAGVTIPTLVIDGDASPQWMRSAADAIAALLPDATRRTLPGQDHDVAPAAIVPVLAEFYGSR
jgi:pimeloyl-ACP methyl ester carboxylesterase